ncbi:ParM/StbA family protein [Limosilactobacillus fastidiosus]|uniref:ParM/StbA family protein n=1 Tax=Limosilactobacillus fastidiosus TaxID=2759855 RepID=A0A7W3TYA0_9LACO|nr:ParM/StbA family protein [Limosilactobacillus fastidiosus]MBB1063152.1 ParM/StbA family protein [Limosilactobacillus fastidiosus]MBB1085432.1 ParM/StbA family protein [Limosilactobacillus fastidiosus]MCD7083733.1 ParM/StbA family protein [Limosilactobacillus fastidiosus]MCD7085414.1 ParM/StbA family protein [Limosilactobacillus fastidiosus]MCD7114821.1 ParM/StbA family protein [Limosilactobacillus fastidiosus]
MTEDYSANEILHFSNDAGNDSMKTYLDGEPFKMPSVIAFKGPQDSTAPISFENEEDKGKYMNDFLNHMDVSISSNAVSENRRFLVGSNAAASGLHLTSFDLNDLSGKSDVDLTALLTLSLIAGNRVKKAYKKGEGLNDPLKVNVNMTTALPILEGKQPGKIDKYRDRYLNATHVVTFHNFKDPIVVQIKFNHVYVGLEGEMAQLMISNSINKQLGQMIINQLKKRYPKVANSLTPEILEKLIQNSLGIDIGGGTTEWTAIVNGTTNLNVSTSLMQGFDNVLEKARLYLQTKNLNFENISQIQEYLSSDTDDFFSNNKEVVKQAITDNAISFNEQIVKQTSSVVRQIGSQLNLVFVYGGGSISLADTSLLDDLSNKLKLFKGGAEVPVIWIPKPYAQVMNLGGLSIVQKALN